MPSNVICKEGKNSVEYLKMPFSENNKSSGKSLQQSRRMRTRKQLICETLTNYDILIYFAIVEFNNSFIIPSPPLFSSYKSVSTVICKHEQNIIYRKTHLDAPYIIRIPISLRWPIQIISPADKIKLSCAVIYRSPDGLPANEKEEINNISSQHLLQ